MPATNRQKREEKPLEYPEHIKLKAIQPKSQAIHDFIEFLQGKGIYLGEYYKDFDRMVFAGRNITNLVAEFFDIDQNKLEGEKRHMIDVMRRANAANG